MYARSGVCTLHFIDLDHLPWRCRLSSLRWLLTPAIGPAFCIEITHMSLFLYSFLSFKTCLARHCITSLSLLKALLVRSIRLDYTVCSLNNEATSPPRGACISDAVLQLLEHGHCDHATIPSYRADSEAETTQVSHKRHWAPLARALQRMQSD